MLTINLHTRDQHRSRLISPFRCRRLVAGPVFPPPLTFGALYFFFVKAKMVSAASVGLGLLSSGLKKLGRMGGATGGVRGGRHSKSR